MSSSPSRTRWTHAAIACATVGLAGWLLPSVSSADAETEARYPFDPACPWGRISNGKGMLQRCISEAEATKVLSDTKKPAVPAAGAVVATPSTPATAAPAAPASTPVDAPVAEPTKPSGPVSVKLSPIVAEQGEVGLGKLAKPLDKYAACIEENGGLTAAKGSVTIQFLVRAELARAEGVEVKKVSGVSAKAARCLADVVDRRQVGAPTVPMTGATLTFEISPSK